jgi:hypothetical protein
MRALVHNLIICITLLSLLFFLSGCTKQEGYYKEVINQTIPQNITKTFEFSVPSELPVAYVGKSYFYSFCSPQPEKVEVYDGEYGYFCGMNITTTNPKGGKPPYSFVFQYIRCSQAFNASERTRYCLTLPLLE